MSDKAIGHPVKASEGRGWKIVETFEMWGISGSSTLMILLLQLHNLFLSPVERFLKPVMIKKKKKVLNLRSSQA